MNSQRVKFEWIIRLKFRSGETNPYALRVLKELNIDMYEDFTKKYLTDEEMVKLFLLDFKVIGSQITIYL